MNTRKDVETEIARSNSLLHQPLVGLLGQSIYLLNAGYSRWAEGKRGNDPPTVSIGINVRHLQL